MTSAVVAAVRLCQAAPRHPRRSGEHRPGRGPPSQPRRRRGSVAQAAAIAMVGRRRVPSLGSVSAPLARRRCVPALPRPARRVALTGGPVLGRLREVRGTGPRPSGEARDQVMTTPISERRRGGPPHMQRHSPWSDTTGPLVAFRQKVAHQSQDHAQHETVEQRRAAVDDRQGDELAKVHTWSVTPMHPYCDLSRGQESGRRLPPTEPYRPRDRHGPGPRKTVPTPWP